MSGGDGPRLLNGKILTLAGLYLDSELNEESLVGVPRDVAPVFYMFSPIRLRMPIMIMPILGPAGPSLGNVSEPLAGL